MNIMRTFLVSAFVLLLATPAFATDAVTAEPLAPLPGANVLVTGEEANTIIPTEQPVPTEVPPPGAVVATPGQASVVCQEYKAMQAVQGPDYVPGVDAYGRPVVPADVTNGTSIDVPERMDIAVQIDVAQAMSFPVPVEANAVPGVVTVFKDGRVLYNNQDVSSQVSSYCATQPQLNVTVQ